MNIPTIISLSGGFIQSVGEIIADLKRRDLASINLDLLRLKRMQLSEKLEDFKLQLNATVKREKAKTEQDLISRGLGNTSVPSEHASCS